jgi:hypothetical protein
VLCATLDSAHPCAPPSSRLPRGPRLSLSGTLVHRLSGCACPAPSLSPFFLRMTNYFLHVYTSCLHFFPPTSCPSAACLPAVYTSARLPLPLILSLQCSEEHSSPSLSTCNGSITPWPSMAAAHQNRLSFPLSRSTTSTCAPIKLEVEPTASPAAVSLCCLASAMLPLPQPNRVLAAGAGQHR